MLVSLFNHFKSKTEQFYQCLSLEYSSGSYLPGHLHSVLLAILTHGCTAILTTPLTVHGMACLKRSKMGESACTSYSKRTIYFLGINNNCYWD